MHLIGPLTVRRHVDLKRHASALCRGGARPVGNHCQQAR
jgi:hypothetical protein